MAYFVIMMRAPAVKQATPDMNKKQSDISQRNSKTLPQVLPGPIEAPAAKPEHFAGEGFRVTLFNDDFHSIDEVVGQILKALKCELDMAVDIMLRAHTRGSATVIIADQATADGVASTLREILLVVSVERV